MKLEDLLLEYQESLPGKACPFTDEMLHRLRTQQLCQPSCFDRDCQPGHFTASAFVLREGGTGLEILLLLHRKLGLWLQPGGHADGCENLAQVAEQELKEETGLSGELLLEGKIFDVDVHMIPPRAHEPEHKHYDVRFLFYAESNQPYWSNHESHALKWFAPKDILECSTACPSVQRMAQKATTISLRPALQRPTI